MLEATQILDASLLPAMVIAAFAGLLSFLSPCVLPIVPPYLAYMGGVSVSDMEDAKTARRRVLLAAWFFVMASRLCSCSSALRFLLWAGCFYNSKTGSA